MAIAHSHVAKGFLSTCLKATAPPVTARGHYSNVAQDHQSVSLRPMTNLFVTLEVLGLWAVHECLESLRGALLQTAVS